MAIRKTGVYQAFELIIFLLSLFRRSDGSRMADSRMALFYRASSVSGTSNLTWFFFFIYVCRPAILVTRLGSFFFLYLSLTLLQKLRIMTITLFRIVLPSWGNTRLYQYEKAPVFALERD